MNKKMKSYLIKINGLVQGVGFRPFIYKIARENNINGWVLNTSESVEIRAEAGKNNIDAFVESIKTIAPINARIDKIKIEDCNYEELIDFKILESKDKSDRVTEISPDIAVCDECLDDMKVQRNRINYPFINCTNCGPRFSIIKDLPYDRAKTTMNEFIMCNECKREYSDISDRRFHAQPVACANCGPRYSMLYNGKIIENLDEIIKTMVDLISQDKIIAFKGLGGFNLACDAFNEMAIKRLREIKNRDNKPFAVMFSNIIEAKKYAYISEREESLLSSPKKPIILLKIKKKIPSGISNGLNTIGVMLPYMPIHFLIFEKLNTDALVYTSGNISDEPIVINNKDAEMTFGDKVDAFIFYDREIYNRVDDSVSFVVNNRERLIRRSRGYVPSSIRLNLNVDGILACGGELKNTVCLGKDDLAYISQHIGDLKNIETYDFFIETIERFKKLFRVEPDLLAIDMHPEYLSTKYAKEIGLKVIEVQHHHAHIASCLVENNFDVEEDVIGVSLDGTGYGSDGKIWGGEFLICNLFDFKRIIHFDYLPMPGGERAIKEPWRMAVSYLFKTFGSDFRDMELSFLKEIDKDKMNLVVDAVKNNINSPLASSAGRLFDGVSALLNLCHYSTFEAEAPMRLEALITDITDEYYSVEINDTIDITKVIKGVVKDLQNNIPERIISEKFHNTIVLIILEVSKIIKNKYNINKIALSGGLFQNRYILERSENLLKKSGFIVYSQRKFPSNDGGISLGQLVVAAKRREKGCV